MKFHGQSDRFLQLEYLAGDTHDHRLLTFTRTLKAVIIAENYSYRRAMASGVIGKLKKLICGIPEDDKDYAYFRKWSDRVIAILRRLHMATGKKNHTEIDDWIAILYTKVRDMILSYPAAHYSF